MLVRIVTACAVVTGSFLGVSAVRTDASALSRIRGLETCDVCKTEEKDECQESNESSTCNGCNDNSADNTKSPASCSATGTDYTGNKYNVTKIEGGEFGTPANDGKVLCYNYKKCKQASQVSNSKCDGASCEAEGTTAGNACRTCEFGAQHGTFKSEKQNRKCDTCGDGA